MSALAVIGTFFGDEGKGKLVDYLASSGNYSIVARSAGGSNSAHTISVNGKSYRTHLIPSGIFSDKILLLGNGMVIDLAFLSEEIDKLYEKFSISCLERLYISDRAHLVFPFHKKVDYLQDQKTGIKTTCQGIGPCYADKISRRGLRMGDLFTPEIFTKKYWALVNHYLEIFPELSDYDFQNILNKHLGEYKEKFSKNIIDTIPFLYNHLQEGKNILVECSQASMLDIDHGAYPFVTSSSTCVGGAINGLGIAPKYVESIGVTKAIITRVTSPDKLVTEFTLEEKKEILESCQKIEEDTLHQELPKAAGTIMNDPNEKYSLEDLFVAKKFREIDASGRPRTCAWFDCVLLKRSCMINGFSFLCLNKLDCLSGLKRVKICTEYYQGLPKYVEISGWSEDISNVKVYSDLPSQAKEFINIIESHVQVPIKYIGVGKDRSQMIVRNI